MELIFALLLKEMKADREDRMAVREELEAEMKADQEEMKAEMRAWLEILTLKRKRCEIKG
jgi:hypothetical protein